MESLLFGLGFAVLWVLAQVWLLPRMGVATGAVPHPRVPRAKTAEPAEPPQPGDDVSSR